MSNTDATYNPFDVLVAACDIARNSQLESTTQGQSNAQFLNDTSILHKRVEHSISTIDYLSSKKLSLKPHETLSIVNIIRREGYELLSATNNALKTCQDVLVQHSRLVTAIEYFERNREAISVESFLENIRSIMMMSDDLSF